MSAHNLSRAFTRVVARRALVGLSDRTPSQCFARHASSAVKSEPLLMHEENHSQIRHDWSTNPSLALPVVAFTTLLWVTSMLYVSKRTRDATLEDVGLTVGDQKLMKSINEHGMGISNHDVTRKVEELSRNLKTAELSEG